MIPDNYKNSLIIPQQLPSFIRGNADYEKFISFLQAYYEYMEQTGNVAERTKNLLNYRDVDNTIDEFQNHFFNEFLQNFPEESLTSKRELVKFSKELYQRKSTPSSFKFLFRALFNSDSEILNAKDYVLVASGGKWNQSKFLRLNTADERFLQTKFLKIFGETSKSVAKIENAVITSNHVDLYISDIVRDFVSGEYIRVVDDQLDDFYIVGDYQQIRAKIVGTTQKITVIPGFGGSGYKIGDPVVISGGINPDKQNPTKAVADVSLVGLASIQEVLVVDGSNGYRSYPNTTISVNGNGTSANIRIGALDTTKTALVDYILLPDTIGSYANVSLNVASYGITANTQANKNTKLMYAFGVSAPFYGYPVAALQIFSGGSNYDATTDIVANSYINLANSNYDIGSFGVLKPMVIGYGGANYSNNDQILFSGGSGFGARARVKSVDAYGTIKLVEYIVDSNNIYTRGGLNYSIDSLPTISVNSSNNKIIYVRSSNATSSSTNVIYLANTANVKIGMYISGNGISFAATPGYFQTDTTITEVNLDSIKLSKTLSTEATSNSIYKIDGTAKLYVDGILGRGAKFSPKSDRIGEVKTIRVTNPGEDYISTPSVSLKVIDIVLYNVNELRMPQEGDVVYQGDVNTSTFRATIDSIFVLPEEAIRSFVLRVYSYNGTLDPNMALYIDKISPNSKDISLFVRTSYSINDFNNGIKFYGDGGARANAEFASGVVKGTGQYVNTDGFLSYSNLLESEIVNEYSYFVIVQKEFIKYKNLLNSILHPAGKQSVNYYNLKNQQDITHTVKSEINKEILLKDVVGVPNTYGILSEPSTLNIYDFDKDLTEIVLGAILSPNDYIHLESTNGETFYSQILEIDSENDIIYLNDGNILDLPNVAYGYTNGNNIIVNSVTGSYDLINDGNYSNTQNKLLDLVYAGDLISITNNSIVLVTNVDYGNNIITTNTELNVSGSNLVGELVSVTRQFRANNIWINYNLDYKYLLGYGNTVTAITIDGFELHDENGNVIYVPLKL